jgi:hypothetical protein
LRYSGANRRRPAASETIGAMLAIAMTLIAGAATWGYVRSQAGASESALQTNAGATNNLLSEHFGVVDMYFSNSTASGGACPGGSPAPYCSAVFWAYNTGSLTFQTFSVRLFGSAGLVNLLFNYTQSGGTRTDYVFDLRSSPSTPCKTAAGSYETPSLTGTTVKTTYAQSFTLTIPPTQSNCPSFGKDFQSGTTYTVVVTGVYGNSATYSQTD